MQIKKDALWASLAIVVAVVFFAIYMNLSLQGLINFGDEGYYAARGEYIKNTLEIPKYIGIYAEDDAIRLLFLDYPMPLFLTAAMFTFGEIGARLLSPLLSILTALTLFLMARRLYSPSAGVFSMAVFLALPSVVTYGILRYGDIEVAALGTFATYIFYRYLESKETKYLVTASIITGFVLLTKVTAFFFPMLFILLLLYKKGKPRDFAIMIGISTIFVLSWFGIHNYIFQGNIGQLPLVDNFVKSDPIVLLKDIPSSTHSSYIATESRVGTGAGLVQFGLLNYVQFAISLWAFILMVAGISYMLHRKQARDKVVLVWAFLLSAVILWFGAGRAEDTSRFMLPAVAPLSIVAGLAVGKIYDKSREYKGALALAAIVFVSLAVGLMLSLAAGAVVALLAVGIYIVQLALQDEHLKAFAKSMSPLVMAVLLAVAVTSASVKADALVPVKNWGGDGYGEACQWVRENTAEDATLLTIWGHNTIYPCKRGVAWPDAYIGDIVFSENETAVERMKLHGIEYVFIQKFAITLQPQWPNYPLSFVRFLDSSPQWFEKSFENEEVVIYKVK